MTPVIITKNVEIGRERWKPSATIVEENINTLPVADVLPQPFVGSDGIYYWPAEVVNNFPQTVIVEPPRATATVVNNHEPQTAAFLPPPPSGSSDLINDALPKDSLPLRDLSVDELKRLIQLQFEYYFSRENLANDSYLGKFIKVVFHNTNLEADFVRISNELFLMDFPRDVFFLKIYYCMTSRITSRLKCPHKCGCSMPYGM